MFFKYDNFFVYDLCHDYKFMALFVSNIVD